MDMYSIEWDSLNFALKNWSLGKFYEFTYNIMSNEVSFKIEENVLFGKKQCVDPYCVLPITRAIVFDAV